MKPIIIYLFLSLYFIFTIADKSCGEQVADFLVCFASQKKDQDAAKPKPITFDEFQKRISSCFTSHGCKDVQLETEENIEKRHNAPPDVLIFDQIEDCKLKTVQLARVNVEKCVAKKIPGFLFPPVVAPRKKGIGRPLTISWGVQVLIELRNNATCPSSADIIQAENCVDKVFDDVDQRERAKNPFESLVDSEGLINRFCKADCFGKINNSCKKVLNDTFPTVCDCVSSDFKDNILKYDTSLQECLGVEAAKSVDYRKNDTVNTIRIKLAEDVCDRLPENPCTKNFIEVLKASKAQGGGGKERSAKQRR